MTSLHAGMLASGGSETTAPAGEREPMERPYYTDDVRGIVIGGDNGTLYKFFTTVPPGVEQYLGDGLFDNDQEAEAHACTTYPVAYARGIEMRAFEREGRAR